MELSIQSSSEPKVTWLMCTNREDALLHRAIESCLSQTMTDFELLIIVNGPETVRLVSTLSTIYSNDKRVRVEGTPIHLLNFSLSFGLHLARAPFVARMDADDVSNPERLAIQLAYMQKNHDVAVVGSSYLLIDDHGHVHGKVDLPESDFAIRNALRWGNPICHPSVMLRRDVLLAEGAYLGGKNAEDYDLWLRIAMTQRWQFVNLRFYLLSYNKSYDGQARRSRVAYANVSGAQLRQFLITRDIRWLIGAIMSGLKCFLLATRS